MEIIVTGSSGLLGRHVARALVKAGHSVVGLDAVAPEAAEDWRHITVDLTDLGAALQLLRGAETTIHVAAIPRPTALPADRVFRNNVSAAYNVVEAAVLNGAQRIIYASSMSVLGYPFFQTAISPSYVPIDSAHPVGPQDVYALSKWLGEEIVEAAVKRRPGLSAISLRMPWIQTPETFERDVVPRRRHAALASRDLWSYLDARDAATAFVAAAESPIAAHKRIFISAADTFMEVGTEALVRTAYPNARFTRNISGYETVFELADARGSLGFAPAFSWRDY
jgi:nucleoside-diphosphate-sugar epimerase